MLGGLQLVVGGRPSPFPSGRPGRLLAALVLARGRAVSVNDLVDDVWADDVPVDPRAALHTTVRRARQALGDEAGRLGLVGAGYRLDLRDVVVDSDEFRRLARQARVGHSVAVCDAALDAWTGAPWPGYADDLARAEAVELGELLQVTRENRVEALLAEGRVDEAVPDAAALVAEDPLRERAAALLIRSRHAAGDVAGALAAYDAHRVVLADELGLDPSPDLVEIHQRVLARRLDDPVRQERRGPRPSTAPAPEPRLVGRAGHVETVTEMLRRTRCVTITGPGGVGKTSVARVLAAREPSWWVDLAEATDPAGVRSGVLAALGLAVFPGSTSDETLRGWAGSASGLLVLDNCEHVLDSAAGLVEDLLEAGSMCIVATSRERLGVSGEQVFALPPLQLPQPEQPDLEAPALRLFLDRAAAAVPDLEPDAPWLAEAAELVRSLDGLPLAIELAAGRLGSVALADLHRRLTGRLELLKSGSRRAPARHRTLSAAVEWSVDLLGENERQVFLGLSVFAGQFDLDAVTAVLGDGAAAVVPDLVDRSLVVGPGPAGSRYRLLETLRSFAEEHLDADDRRRLRDRHAAWAAQWTRRAAEARRGPDEREWAVRTGLILPDLLAAVHWSTSEGDLESAAVVVAELFWWSYLRGRPDVLALALEVLAAPGCPALPPEVRAGVEATAAAHAWMSGDLARAEAHAARGAELAGDNAAVASRCRGVAGDVFLALGDAPRGIAEYDASRDLAELAGLPADALIQGCGGLLARAFRGQDWSQQHDGLRRLAAGTVNPSADAFRRYTEGELLATSDPERALECFAEAIELAEDVGSALVVGVSLTAEASLVGLTGPLDARTTEHVATAVRHWREAGSRTLLVTCLRNVVPLLERLDEHAAVARLLAALEIEDARRPSYGAEAERLSAAHARSRSRLGAAFDEEWSRGLAHSLEAAAAGIEAVLASAMPASQ